MERATVKGSRARCGIPKGGDWSPFEGSWLDPSRTVTDALLCNGQFSPL
jgi:hypothetical protein